MTSVLLVVLTSARAAAAATLTPPRVAVRTEVTYPRSAHGDARVVLALEVAETGDLTNATVIEGDEPFASAALATVRAWRFDPATRDGAPMRARFRVALAFTEPDALTMTTTTATPPPPLPTPVVKTAPPVVPVEDVKVAGAKHDPSEVRLTVAEAREIPGAAGDPLRATLALPGVLPLSSANPYAYLRGAPPNNVGFLVDGVRVPLLFHAGAAPSVIQPQLLDRIDLFASAAPASIGGFAGGVMQVETRAPRDEYHGGAIVNAYEASAIVEAPLEGHHGSVLGSVRVGYPELVLKIASPDEHLDYWDYQERVSVNVGPRDRVGVFAFGSHDRYGHTDDVTGAYQEAFASDFHRVDLRYDHDLDHGGRVRAAATWGWSSQGAAPTYVDDWTGAARVELEARPTDAIRVRSGFQAELDVYSSPAFAGPPTNVEVGVYADAVMRLGSHVTITPGLRGEVLSSSRAAATNTVPAIEPKLAARVDLGKRLAWIASLGVAHQLRALRVADVSGAYISVPGFQTGDPGIQTSNQAASGFELRLPLGIVTTATAFASFTRGQTDLTQVCPSTAPCDDRAVDGAAYGLEVSIRRALTERLTGWITYTLSRSTENGTLGPFDRTHVLNVIAAYDFGAHWKAGARLLYYSGVPFEGVRLADFVRVDARIEKRWVLPRDRWISFVIEGQNVTASRETRVHCDGPKCAASLDPAVIIPSLGAEATF